MNTPKSGEGDNVSVEPPERGEGALHSLMGAPAKMGGTKMSPPGWGGPQSTKKWGAWGGTSL